jgi:hypothetical protein
MSRSRSLSRSGSVFTQKSPVPFVYREGMFSSRSGMTVESSDMLAPPLPGVN